MPATKQVKTPTMPNDSALRQQLVDLLTKKRPRPASCRRQRPSRPTSRPQTPRAGNNSPWEILERPANRPSRHPRLLRDPKTRRWPGLMITGPNQGPHTEAAWTRSGGSLPQDLKKRCVPWSPRRINRPLREDSSWGGPNHPPRSSPHRRPQPLPHRPIVLTRKLSRRLEEPIRRKARTIACKDEILAQRSNSTSHNPRE